MRRGKKHPLMGSTVMEELKCVRRHCYRRNLTFFFVFLSIFFTHRFVKACKMADFRSNTYPKGSVNIETYLFFSPFFHFVSFRLKAQNRNKKKRPSTSIKHSHKSSYSCFLLTPHSHFWETFSLRSVKNTILTALRKVPFIAECLGKIVCKTRWMVPG